MPIDYEIGYVNANTMSGQISYEFFSCSYILNSIVYTDAHFCNMFSVDSSSGIFQIKLLFN